MENVIEYRPLTLTEQAVNAMKQFEPLIENVRDYAVLTVSDDGIEKVTETRKGLKRLRLDIEAKRKELKAGALEYGKTVDNIAKQLSQPVIEVEGILSAQEEEFEAERHQEREAKKAAKAVALQARIDALQKAGCAVDLAAVAAMSDDDFAWHLGTESKRVAEARAEFDRLETLRFAEMERQADELRQRDRELAEAREAMEREREAMLHNQSIERQHLEAQQAEVRRQQEEIAAVEYRKAEAERQRVLAERQEEDKRLTEIARAEAEAAEAARLEALKPDIEKAYQFMKAADVWADQYLTSIGRPAWSESALVAIERACIEIGRNVERGES